MATLVKTVKVRLSAAGIQVAGNNALAIHTGHFSLAILPGEEKEIDASDWESTLSTEPLFELVPAAAPAAATKSGASAPAAATTAKVS